MSSAKADKRRMILDTAARLFASQRFHEVKLDAIAAAAGFGKGTIYLYFPSKEDLYAALILDGLETLLVEIKRPRKAGPDAWRELEGIVDALLAFARRNPQLYALMRAGGGCENTRIDELRRKLAGVCEAAIRRGVRKGAIADTHPALTAQYLLSFVRVALLYAPRGITASTLRKHMLGVLRNGIGNERSTIPAATRQNPRGRRPDTPHRHDDA